MWWWIIFALLYITMGTWTAYKFYMMCWEVLHDRDYKKINTSDRIITKVVFFVWPAGLIALSIIWWLNNEKELPAIPGTPRWMALRKMKRLEMLEKARKELIGESKPEVGSNARASVGSLPYLPNNSIYYPSTTTRAAP